MSNLAISQDFSGTGWRKRLAGSGAVTITSGVARCTGIGDGVATLDYYIPVLPGTVVSVEMWARALSGTAVIELSRIDAAGASWTTADTVTLTGSALRKYRLTAVVPYQTSAKPFIRLTMGVGSAVAGDAEYTFPLIHMDGSSGVPVTLARGFVRVEGGVASLPPNFLAHGVSAVDRIDATTVKVSLVQPLPSTPQNVRPLILVTGTPDKPWIPVAGSILTGSAPRFLMNWTNGTAFQDISATNVYASFEVTY